MENNNNLLMQYYKKFKENPPIISVASYESENYQKALKYAIENNLKLDYSNIGKFFKNNYDLVETDEKGVEENMEDTKIRKLLKEYGASDEEIENFMQDLSAEATDAVEDEEEIETYALSKDNVDKMKLTEEGKDLIMKAPEMAKEELEEAIKQYFAKYDK